ncbi:MAG: hypothetical protein OSB10_03375 [Planctomycetota bacterium]|nr:hypothetical protein [Planctomycetota bacterium]
MGTRLYSQAIGAMSEVRKGETIAPQDTDKRHRIDAQLQAHFEARLNRVIALPLWVHGIDFKMDFPPSIWGGVIQ